MDSEVVPCRENHFSILRYFKNILFHSLFQDFCNFYLYIYGFDQYGILSGEKVKFMYLFSMGLQNC